MFFRVEESTRTISRDVLLTIAMMEKMGDLFSFRPPGLADTLLPDNDDLERAGASADRVFKGILEVPPNCGEPGFDHRSRRSAPRVDV